MTSLGAQLSVPCTGCQAAIRFGQDRCSCGTAVSADLKRALGERLKAASSDYREFDLKLSRARAMLLVCAAGQLGVGVLFALFASRGDAASALDMSELWTALLIDGLAAVGFVGAFYVSLRQPLRGLAVGGAVWAVSHLSAWRLDAGFSETGVFLAFAIALILLRGWFAARDAERMRQRLIAEAIQQPSAG